MTYSTLFHEKAQEEFDKQEKVIKEQILKKLIALTSNPRIPKNKLKGMPDCYKIKLASAGIRCVYKVEDSKLLLLVLVIDKREDNKVYESAQTRLEGD
ncbi:type II toxin-antitoxin system RelE/ParE family toxin [Gluconobacter sp. LMG 1744]|uniref:type II toxin-antitoxin system RelE family toxin n=1 Tax=Gluconobacter cadivus TaxID=2728101 RepID=UPI001885A0CB|nr:type II toxin-antitoxin system RelE/ParE family toxin [Gluconobacter cadivus]MBF0892753.1 type II toxin-antitoxin system RelE/ParE family toxin [Gluconobacter cadivus]